MQEKTRQNLAKIVIIFLGFLIPSFIFLGVLKGPIYSASSDTINLQGKIVRNDAGYEGLNISAGSPACVVSGDGNDTCDFRIRYYDAPTAGNLLLTEQFSNTEIGQYVGVFNLSLGSDPAPVAGVYTSLSGLIQGESDVYVEVGFDPAGGSTYTEVFSRMPLEASGYAIRAKYADSATGATEMSWSGLKSPTGNLSLQHSTYTTLFNWATGTGTNNLFSLTSDASANGTGALMNVQTGVGSTLIPLRVRAGTTEAIYVNSSGNVGIGTTTLSGASGDLTVYGGDIFLGSSLTQLSADASYFYLNAPDGTTRFHLGASAVDKRIIFTLHDASGVAKLQVRDSGTAEVAYINSDGGAYFADNVGIGTTSPVSLLSVGSTSQFQVNSSGDIVKLKNLTYSWPFSHTTDGFLKNDGSGNLTWTTITGLGGISGTGVAGQATFWTDTSTVSGDNAFWWDNTNKRLGIGTTTPQEKLTLASASNFATEMSTPGAPTLTCNTTGGTLADGTYYYKIVASDGVGTTVGSTQGSCTITGGLGAGSVSISWSGVTGASSYRIYGRDTGYGQYWTSSSTSYTDTGTVGTTGTPPTVTTAYVNKLTASGDSWLLGGNVRIGTSLTTPLIQGRATDPYELTLKSTVNAYNAIRVVNATNVEVMSFDTMNSRVGIGITVPSTQLHTTGGVRLAGITASTESTAVMADVDGNLSKRGLGLLAFEDSVPGDNWGTQVVQTNTTLTGDGTFTTPLGINLANANTWTASQTFSASTYFPGSGIWNSTGNVGIGTQAPGSSKLYVSGSSTSLVNLGDTLYVDSTNKRVSIGGGTPAVRFHIQETIGGINKAYITNVGTTDAENQLWFGTGYGGIDEKWSGIGQVHSDGSLRFTAGGSLSTPQMTLLPNGNFGIGVVNPSSKLTLYGSSTATTIGGFEVGMRIANTNTTTNNWQSIVFGDTAKAGIEVKNVDHTNDYGDIAFTTRASDGWLPRMYIQSGGYVGVGNSAPVSLFSVGSSSQFQVDTLGDITKIKNLSYTWPTAHTASGFLKNNGTGGLSWAEVNAVQSTGTPYGSATEGPLAFWTGTSTISAPTPYGLYWDDVNQYLGIGTNNPSAPLDIAGGTGGSLIKNSSGDITIEPAANLIISQGNVGIGVTVPLAKLHVKGNQILLKNEADADLGIVLDSGSTTTYRDVIYFKDRGTDVFGLEKTSTNAFQLYDYAGTGVSRILVEGGTNSGISFRSKGTGDFSFITDTTTRVTIKSDGKVGIGTTGPGGLLDINAGTLTWGVPVISQQWTTNDSGYNLRLETLWTDAGVNQNFVQKYNSVDYNVLSFYVGNVGIGTTSPGAKLDVAGTGKFGDYALIGTDISAGYYQDSLNGAYRAIGTTGDRGYFFQSYGGTSTTMYVGLTGTYAGRVGIGTTGPSQLLDVQGNIYSTGSLGVMLNQQNAPLITRGWDAFTSGNYSGAGRWGLFMESAKLTFGVPALASRDFQFVTYNADSSIASTLMYIQQAGNVGIGTTAPSTKLDVNGDVKVRGDQVRISSVELRYKSGNNGTATCSTYCAGSDWGGWAGSCVAAVGADGAVKTCTQTHTTTLYCLCMTVGTL